MHHGCAYDTYTLRSADSCAKLAGSDPVSPFDIRFSDVTRPDVHRIPCHVQYDAEEPQPSLKAHDEPPKPLYNDIRAS